MINGDVNEFAERVSCGGELIFLRKEKHFLQDRLKDGPNILYLDIWIPPSEYCL